MNVSNFRNKKDQRIDAVFQSASRDDVIVLIGHGITANKDRPFLAAISDNLALHGIPSIRFSFSGNGNSEGRFEEATIENEVADLEAILEQIPSNIKVTYAGHSMGGAVGVIAASKGNPRIQNLVSLAGMVDTAGFFEREFGDRTPGSSLMWDREGCPLDQAHIDNANKIGSTLAYAAKIKCPWLLIHGTEDAAVPLCDSQNALKAATCPVELLELPGDDHLFSEATFPVIANAIAIWINTH